MFHAEFFWVKWCNLKSSGFALALSSGNPRASAGAFIRIAVKVLQVILAPVGPLTTRLTITASSARTMQFTTTVESRSQMLTVLLSAHF